MIKSFLIYFFFAIIGLSIIANFYGLIELNKKHDAIQTLLDFKDKGARYTWKDGQDDRLIRDQVDAFLQAQIDELKLKCY